MFEISKKEEIEFIGVRVMVKVVVIVVVRGNTLGRGKPLEKRHVCFVCYY